MGLVPWKVWRKSHTAGKTVMSNPNPPPPPKHSQFGKAGGNRQNPGGRTPTAWLRERLSRAARSGDMTEREAIYEHMLEVATSWEVRVVGKDSNGELLKVASGKDSVEAAKLLMAYDMGKPPNPVEITGHEGGPIQTTVAAQTTAELRQMVAGMLGLPVEELPEQIIDAGPAASPEPAK